MVVKIRLSRFGNRHSPFYNIVVAQARSARDSKPLEVIGTLNPLPQQPTNLSDEEAKIAKPFKEISLVRSRAKYWLGVGAQPSERVWKLFSMIGLVEPKVSKFAPKQTQIWSFRTDIANMIDRYFSSDPDSPSEILQVVYTLDRGRLFLKSTSTVRKGYQYLVLRYYLDWRLVKLRGDPSLIDSSTFDCYPVLYTEQNRTLLFWQKSAMEKKLGNRLSIIPDRHLRECRRITLLFCPWYIWGDGRCKYPLKIGEAIDVMRDP